MLLVTLAAFRRTHSAFTPPPTLSPAPAHANAHAHAHAGDVCVLYRAGGGRVAAQMWVNVTACDCFSICRYAEDCGARMFCPAAQKRAACQAAEPVPAEQGNPCPRWVGVRVDRWTGGQVGCTLPGMGSAWSALDSAPGRAKAWLGRAALA